MPRTRTTSPTWCSAPYSVARQQKLAKPGERLVITAGVPFGTPGATNILRIAYV